MQLAAVFIILLVASSFVSGIDNGQRQTRIKGGSFAQSGEFPYIVSIAVDGSHICAGFIYNSEWVVTTASCVDNVQLLKAKVVVGQLSLITDDTPYEKAYDIFSLIKYDGYNEATKLHDLALVQLAQDIDFSSHVTCIYYDEPDDYPFRSAEIMGWGATFENATVPSTRLRKGEITNLSANYANYTGFDRNYMICAGGVNDRMAPCRFDEGGPLVQDNFDFTGKIAVGIFSNSIGCESGLPAVFTRLAPYLAR